VEETKTNEALLAELAAENAELKRALSQAERHVERLTRIIEAIPGAVWELEGSPGSPDYRMTYVNAGIEELLGYPREEWIGPGSRWLSIVHPEDKGKLIAEISASTPGKASEYRLIAKDGREVWIEPHLHIIRDDAGTRTGFCGIALDVTTRVRTQRSNEELLARSQELKRRLNDIVASVPGVVWEERGLAGTPNHEVSFASDYVRTLLGYSAEECQGNPRIWQQVAHPEDQAHAARTLRELYEKGGGTLQYRWITKDGRTIWVETHLRVIRDEAGAPIGARGVTMDITARKLAEEDQARGKDEAIEAQAAALLELSTPLIPISQDVMVMPLIGAIDSARAARVIEALVRGLHKARARFAILDITGVPRVDAQTADALLRAARSVQLLGAQVVLTGIRPEVAQMLITLGTSLEGIVTCSNLESGIAYATSRR
jgi:rsbT co-antagonist protein RsbR